MNVTDTEKQQIVELVVAYGAYQKALSNPDRGPERDNALWVWGKMLIGRQQQTGIEVIAPRWIVNVIKHIPSLAEQEWEALSS